MEHEVDSGAGFVHGVEVENVGLAEVDAIENVGDVFPLAGGVVVDATHLLAAGQQRPRQG